MFMQSSFLKYPKKHGITNKTFDIQGVPRNMTVGE